MTSIISIVKKEIETNLKDQYGTCKRLCLSVSDEELQKSLKRVAAIKDENDFQILNEKMSHSLNPETVPILDKVLDLVRTNEKPGRFFHFEVFEGVMELSHYNGSYEDFIKSWNFPSPEICTSYGQIFAPLQFKDPFGQTDTEFYTVLNLLECFEINSDGRSIEASKCIILSSLTSGMMVPKNWDFPGINLN